MPKCHITDCNNKAILIVGSCNYCKHNYCGTHRLPEEHLCENMEELRKNKFNLNAKKVMSEKCVATKTT